VVALGDSLTDFLATSVLARLDRDVLAKSGARHVIVLAGINDLGIPGAFGRAGEDVTADDVIAGLFQIVARSHALGLEVHGSTLLPFEGTAFPGYYSAAAERKRQAINAWIRSAGAFDAVIDLEAAVRDPAHPTRLRPAFDSGDHLHLNDAGYRAMAEAVDLRLFR
jgi:lysophospholipase L1-like esterase